MTMPTDNGGQSAADGGQGAAGTGATGTTDSATSQGGGDAGTNQPNPASPAGKTAEQLQAELEAVTRRMQAADSNNSKTQAELKRLQDAQLSEAEKTKRDLEAAQTALAEREEQIKQERIKNAFVTDNTYEWHNPSAALKLADLSGVEIHDDGKVTGLKEALKSVADANSWMLKPKTAAATGEAATTGGATGVGGRGSDTASGADKAGIEKRFPQLKGRIS
jgi:hypothetical protein